MGVSGEVRMEVIPDQRGPEAPHLMGQLKFSTLQRAAFPQGPGNKKKMFRWFHEVAKRKGRTRGGPPANLRG